MSFFVKVVFVAGVLVVVAVLFFVPAVNEKGAEDEVFVEDKAAGDAVISTDTTPSDTATSSVEETASEKEEAVFEEEELAPAEILPDVDDASISLPLAPVPKIPETVVLSTSTLVEIVAPSTIATTSTEVGQVLPSPSPLPPLNEEALLRAVVKIQCPAAENKGIYVGSGFVIDQSTVVTAAHVVMNAGEEECDVIFPSKRKPVHYLKGTLEDIETIKKRHDEEGIDVARLTLTPPASYPEAEAIFGDMYPAIPYSICDDAALLGDALLHFGYPSNFKDQSYLSALEGEVVVFADIGGIENQLSLDQTVVYKTPVFSYSNNETVMHPYIVSRVPSFYGDSGGLAFNKTKQCILGPHRGGTVGKAPGENFTIFMNVGWSGARQLFE